MKNDASSWTGCWDTIAMALSFHHFYYSTLSRDLNDGDITFLYT